MTSRSEVALSAGEAPAEPGPPARETIYSRMEVDFRRRSAFLKESLKTPSIKNVLYLYDHLDYSTFRYRAYNVCQALEDSPSVRAHFFFRAEIEGLRRYLPHVDACVMVRLRWSPEVDTLLGHLGGLRKKVYFDVDDLVFDNRYLPLLMNTVSLDMSDQATLDTWFGYVGRLDRVAGVCDGHLCTNDYLAGKLREKYGKEVRIIPNLLNREQAEFSASLMRRPRRRGPGLRIGYFSGSPSHNNDFYTVAGEVGEFLRRHDDAHLQVVGFLDLPPEFAALAGEGRVTVEPLKTYLDLQESIWSVDVNIVPLIVNDFTHSKSELKYFESAVVGVPTIASKTYSYAAAIRHGENGFLCDPGEWLGTLEALYEGQRLDATTLAEVALPTYLNLRRRHDIEVTLLQL
jgi:glycosyltransferase involved in cell wall biosynthesis